MAVPEGYEKLAVVGIAYKGEYEEGKEYKQFNGVYYNGSTYVALKDGVTSVPYNDGINWKYLAQGFISHNLSELEAIDSEGIIGTAGDNVGAQELIDGIASDLKTGDTAENTTTFTSEDNLSPEEWADVGLIESGEKQKTLFGKISNMFKNVRYLFNVLGSTDISSIGNGTVTGAISSINADFANITFDKIYPVGSIYMSVSATNPSALFGGTWVAWGTGRVPVGVNTADGDFNAAEKAGGSKTNTHYHFTPFSFDSDALYLTPTSGGIPSSRVLNVTNAGTIIPTRYTAAMAVRQDSTFNQSISILQPYITCYMWKRTA